MEKPAGKRNLPKQMEISGKTMEILRESIYENKRVNYRRKQTIS